MRTQPSNGHRPADDVFNGAWIYQGTAHAWARGKNLRVRIVAVIRDSDTPNARMLHSMAELDGGVRADDVVEFAPWIDAEGRFSWATSDARIADLRRE